MEITKEQIKRLAKAVKAMQEDTLIDDDVSGGYQPEPFKTAYAEIYQVIDECARGLNVNTGGNIALLPDVSQQRELFICKMAGKGTCFYETEDGKCEIHDPCVNHIAK